MAYASMDDLNEHMHNEDHTEMSDAFQCLKCNKSFATKRRLYLHTWRHEKQKKIEKHACSLCGLQMLPKSMKLHMRTHTGEKPFKCNICDYESAQSGSLKIHKHTHDPVRKVVGMCPTCGKSFIHKSHYKDHIRTAHSNLRPYICAHCGKTFSTNPILKKHMLYHGGDRKHVCTYCGKAFLHRSSMAKHVKIHTGERPHECSICGRRFLEKCVRDSHMKTHRDN